MDDGWDWRYLYYVGTVILGMSEKDFWKCTPRKLAALTEIHVELHSSGKKPTANFGYIDQVL